MKNAKCRMKVNDYVSAQRGKFGSRKKADQTNQMNL